MTFIATFTGIVIAMILMALGVLAGRPSLRKKCGEECDCIHRVKEEHKGENL